jgi:hypothetical protein
VGSPARGASAREPEPRPGPAGGPASRPGGRHPRLVRLEGESLQAGRRLRRAVGAAVHLHVVVPGLPGAVPAEPGGDPRPPGQRRGPAAAGRPGRPAPAQAHVLRAQLHFDFRRRLLELPGWEQFTALFLFFVSEDDRLDGDDDRARFAAKVPHEVRATTGALGGWRRGCPRSAAGARAAGRDPGLSRPASGPGRGRRGSAPARTGTRCRSRSRAGGRGRWRSR